MKILVKSFLVLLFIFSGCKEDPSKEKNIEDSDSSSYSTSESSEDLNKDKNEKDKNLEEREGVNKDEKLLTTGTFQKIVKDKKDKDCKCDCVTIDMADTKRICVDEKSETEIEVKYKEGKNNEVMMYYVSGAGEIEGMNEIPWDDFDTNTPLAILNYTSGSTFELDWKGFTIDDELAVDYAILGKKNLEGEYQKK